MTAKDGTNGQWGLATSDGTRATAGAAFPALGNGEGGPPSIDGNGNVWVRPVGGTPPAPGFLTAWQEHNTSELTDSAQIRGTVDPANQFMLDQVGGFVNAIADTDVCYVQLFNGSAAPAVGATPQISIRIVGSQNYSWAPGQYHFPDGIWFALSTSPNDYAAGTTALGWYTALGWESLP